MAAPRVAPSILRSLILLGLVLLFLYLVGKGIFWLFGGIDLQRSAVTMQVQEGGTVNVSLEGGLMQRAEDSIKLYGGDRVATGGNGHALLTFFDGTVARMDEQSDVNIVESGRGEEESAYTMELTKGALWIRTPEAAVFSGAITRTVDTPRYTVTLPSDAEVVAEEGTLLVFNADGQGAEMLIDGLEEPVYIGEGQQIALPDGEIAGDPLQWRSAIEPLAVQRAFIEESRTIQISDTGTGAVLPDEEDLLTVTAPADRTTVTTATVTVEGTVAPRVERVRINGNDATINRSAGTFSQDLALADTGETTITVEALDARGISLEQISRTVIRGSEAIQPPVITSPAQAGQTYRTSDTEFAITGTVPAGTAGVMVNEYRLQLFRSGDTTWSYLASTALNNLRQGTNVYDVYALDAAGNKSQPARITIMLGAGAEGVVSDGTSSAGAASSAATVDESTLPQNAPLSPGTVNVTGPTPGSSHTATGSEFLLEGTAPSTTHSVWVNGYRLQLYEPGRTYWNYIARTDYGTLKPGTNVYTITARNEENEILDQFEYTVTYNP